MYLYKKKNNNNQCFFIVCKNNKKLKIGVFQTLKQKHLTKFLYKTLNLKNNLINSNEKISKGLKKKIKKIF